MLRQAIDQIQSQDPLFRWRTTNVLRIENLSDIVFALALGILVSSGRPVVTFNDLSHYLLSIIPIAAGFAVLVGIWNAHYVYFRRYAFVDGRVIFLNTILLLLILYIAYPLRFAFESFFGFVLLVFGYDERILALGVEYRESGIIIGYFSAGFAVIHLVLSGLYGHALRKHRELALTEEERILTRRQTWVHLSFVLVGALVAGLALGTALNGFAGVFLLLTGVAAQIIAWLTPLPKPDAAAEIASADPPLEDSKSQGESQREEISRPALSS